MWSYFFSFTPQMHVLFLKTTIEEIDKVERQVGSWWRRQEVHSKRSLSVKKLWGGSFYFTEPQMMMEDVEVLVVELHHLQYISNTPHYVRSVTSEWMRVRWCVWIFHHICIQRVLPYYLNNFKIQQLYFYLQVFK